MFGKTGFALCYKAVLSSLTIPVWKLEISAWCCVNEGLGLSSTELDLMTRAIDILFQLLDFNTSMPVRTLT